jgi:hypothetical protein
MVKDYVKVYEQLLGIPAKMPAVPEGEISGLTASGQV